MRVTLIAIGFSFLIVQLSSGLVLASEELMMKDRCNLCHDVKTKKVGPAFADVAAQYKAEDAPALVKKVLQGSGGKWGDIPMPPQQVSEEDAKALVDWILTLK